MRVGEREEKKLEKEKQTQKYMEKEGKMVYEDGSGRAEMVIELRQCQEQQQSSDCETLHPSVLGRARSAQQC